MKFFFGTLAAIAFLLVGSATSATAQTRVLSGLSVDIPIQGVPIRVMLISYERQGGGRCLTGTCCKKATVTFYDNPAFNFALLTGLSFPSLSLQGTLANGRPGQVSLTGVIIQRVTATTVNGQKAWTVEFCYDQQIVSLGGQDLE